MDIRKIITDSIRKAITVYRDLPSQIVPTLDIPQKAAFGDFSTNVAMVIASHTGLKPKDVAVNIKAGLEIPQEICYKVTVAGAGFINFYLSSETLHSALKDILLQSRDYGKNHTGGGKKILIEFVSANPTGPLTIAHARQAAVGDVLSNLFSACGFLVEKEYYLNDRGRQMRLLAESTRARYLELVGIPSAFPEDGYKGEYVKDIARSIEKEAGDKYKNVPENNALDFFREYAQRKILDIIKKDLADFGVVFTSWVSETELVNSGIVNKIKDVLEHKGYAYPKDGAWWFKSTVFGDDKDRVLVKSNGDMTYLLPDIAYHESKYKKGFQPLINIWGPDHHGYIPRLKAGVAALGHSASDLQIIIVQLTTLYRNGEQVSMSTRAGEFVSLRDLLCEVGRDASRYFLVMRKPEAHLDFDLDVAKKETNDNPVYYIQYAHARISSVLAKYKETAGDQIVAIDSGKIDLGLLAEPEELALIKYLMRYPDIVYDAAFMKSPHFLTDYLETLVAKFHNYYEKHRIINDDGALTRARIALIQAVQIVLRNGLTILGVDSPERM